MINCGVEGFTGHIRPIIPFITECYLCSNEVEETNKNESSNSALCSIRGIPETNTHCIFWAQQFFEKLVAEKETNDLEAIQIFERIFYTDVIKNFSDSLNLIERANKLMDYIDLKADFIIENLNIYKVWNLKDHINSFLNILNIFLQSKFENIKNDNNNLLLIFLCDAANIRSYIFQPFSQELFPFSFADMMGVINKVIPALASSNSITAGLMISKMIKILNLQRKNINILWFNNQENFRIKSYKLKGRNKNCLVCGDNVIFLEILCNFQKNTLKVRKKKKILIINIIYNKEIIDYFNERLFIIIERITFSNNTIFDKRDEINKKIFEKLAMDKLVNLAKDLKKLQLEFFTEKNEFKIYLDLNFSIADYTKLKFDGKNVSKLMKAIENFRKNEFFELNIKRSLLFQKKN